MGCVVQAGARGELLSLPTTLDNHTPTPHPYHHHHPYPAEGLVGSRAAPAQPPCLTLYAMRADMRCAVLCRHARQPDERGVVEEGGNHLRAGADQVCVCWGGGGLF